MSKPDKNKHRKSADVIRISMAVLEIIFPCQYKKEIATQENIIKMQKVINRKPNMEKSMTRLLMIFLYVSCIFSPTYQSYLVMQY